MPEIRELPLRSKSNRKMEDMKTISKTCKIVPLILGAFMLAGCGDNSGDYSKYVTLGDYQNLSATLHVEAVTDEELDTYQEELLRDYVTYEKADGPVKEGQLVYVSLLAKEGDEVVYDFVEDGYELTVGEKEFGEEVDDAMIGSVPGDTLDREVSFDSAYEDGMLAGKDISFHIEVLSVSDVIHPELTDSFVKETLGAASVEAWRDTLREELLSNHQAEATGAMRDELVKKAVDQATIQGYPKALYEKEQKAVEADYQSYADMFGCSLEEVYELFGLDEEARKREYLDETYRTMVLSMIRKQEGLSLSDEELQGKLEEFSTENEYASVDELLEEYTKESLESYFLDEMTIDFLEERADIEMTTE